MAKAKTKTKAAGALPHWGNYSAKQGRTKDALIDSAMRHVIFDGFGEQALLLAAQENDIPEAYALSLFPEPEADMITWHSMLADTRMLQEYEDSYDHDSLKVHERIKTLIMIRFKQNAPDRETIRIALRKLLYPNNSTLAFRLLSRTCDNVWNAAGDTATDWNYYSKRTLLAGVYSTTLPIWLDDESEDLQATEAFLLRRLTNVLDFGKMTSNIKPMAEQCMAVATHPLRFFRALSRYGAHKSRF